MCNSVLLLRGRGLAMVRHAPKVRWIAYKQYRRLSVYLSIHLSNGLCIYYFLVFNEATVYNNDLYQMKPDYIKLLLLIVMIYPELYDLDLFFFFFFFLPNPNKKAEALVDFIFGAFPSCFSSNSMTVVLLCVFCTPFTL